MLRVSHAEQRHLQEVLDSLSCWEGNTWLTTRPEAAGASILTFLFVTALEVLKLLHLLQNIVTRVASLPLISSAYSMCSAFYTHAKETHPHLNTACSVVELVAAVAVGTIDLTKDIVQDSVALTKLVVNSTVNTAVNAASEAKGLVSHRVADVVNLSKGTVQDSVDLTKMVTCGPVQEGIEMTSLISPVSVTEQQQLQSYFVRLGSLSSKVRQRAYLHSLKKLRLVKENTQNTLSQLQLVISLVEHLKHGVGQRFQDAQEKLNNILREWLQTQPGERQSAGEDALQEVPLTPQPSVESRTLTMLRILTKHLGPMYTQVVARIEGLPSHVGERIDQAISNIRQLHTSFSSAGSIQDLTSSILAQSNEKIADAHEALDSLVDHVVQNTPLNWVVGPFRPSTHGAPKQGFILLLRCTFWGSRARGLPFVTFPCVPTTSAAFCPSGNEREGKRWESGGMPVDGQ
uniref:Perilipin n=1 Tax=Varanus komodoensis TaxID=61221 RepID=A0A8D2LSR7_VARKO